MMVVLGKRGGGGWECAHENGTHVKIALFATKSDGISGDCGCKAIHKYGNRL